MPNFVEDYDDIGHLVDLLDEEDTGDDNGTPTSIAEKEEVESQSQTSNNTIVSKKLPGQLQNYEMTRPKSSAKSADNNNGNSFQVIDPLEIELAQMEERMKKLKAELCKKKNISKNCENKISFTKFSQVVENQKETIRNLTNAESTEVLLSLNASKSEIHSGETDSEDDEDNRNPYDQNLSSSGREMKKRIAYANDKDILSKRNESANKPQYNTTKVKYDYNNAGTANQLLSGSKKAQDSTGKQNDTIDPFSGIKLCNPLISSTGMKELMNGRKMIQMSSIALHTRDKEIAGDWVTIGIIVSKSEPKKSQKGSQYLIWQLSDLRDCTKVVSLFLFADAYKHLWKTTVGSAVGILNPQIMKERENEQRNSMSVSINNHQNVLIMGTSKDLGWCKGRTKIGPCRQFVNKSVCEYCVYHIQREYQKTSSKRADLQSSFTNVDPRKAFQKRVLGKDQVFYGGNLFGSGPPERKTTKRASKLATASKSTKDLNTLSSLNIKLRAKEAQEEDKKKFLIKKPVHLTSCQVASVKEIAKVNEDFGQMLLAPTPGALNLLKHISKEPHQNKSSNIKAQELSAKELLAETKKELLQQKRKKLLNNTSKTPQLGRGFGPGKDFEFDVSPMSSSIEATKHKAANILKQNGGLKVQEKNMKRNKEKALSADYQENIKKKMKISMENEDCNNESSTGVPVEKADPLFNSTEKKSHLGSLNLNSNKFQSMIRAKSRHTNLIQVAEDEQVEKYYNSLEKKEMLENKLVSIMEIPTSAVVCLQCKYKAISASEHCREEGHPLKSIKAVKRFFECQNCKRRTTSLDKHPGKSCSNCDQTSWKRVGMGKEKQAPKLENEILSLRGDELSHYSGTSNQIFLHL